MANPNLQLLLDAAKLLKPILGELVFVSGCTAALLITDKGAADVRPTYDVDAIAEITSYAGYTEFSERRRPPLSLAPENDNARSDAVGRKNPGIFKSMVQTRDGRSSRARNPVLRKSPHCRLTNRFIVLSLVLAIGL
jgi:hypothetical protein